MEPLTPLPSSKKSEQAGSYYKLAADAGNSQAAATLAVMLVTGELPEDTQQAKEYAGLAESLGYPVDELFDRVGLDLEELFGT